MRPTALIAGMAIFLGSIGVAAAASQMAYKVVEENSIPKSLTGKPGDPTRGKKVAVDRKKGNCLACHVMPISSQQFHGEVGPTLVGVGSRYDEGELRLRVVNPKILNPESIMPAFFKSKGFHRPLKKFEGKSVLKAQEIEDVIAYLKTLKDSQ